MDPKLVALCIAAASALSAVATGLATSRDFDEMATLVDAERASRKEALAAAYADSKPDDFKCQWVNLDGRIMLAVTNNGTYDLAYQKDITKFECPKESTKPPTPVAAPIEEPAPIEEIP